MTYRDLGKPIGAHSSDKLDKFKSKYFEIINKQSGYGQFGAQQMIAHHAALIPDRKAFSDMRTDAGSAAEGNNEKPYMYLSHYSTPGIVYYYLIR